MFSHLPWRDKKFSWFEGETAHFFFCMTVSVKLGRIFAVSRVLGVENLKPMVVSLKLGVLAMLKAEGL